MHESSVNETAGQDQAFLSYSTWFMDGFRVSGRHEAINWILHKRSRTPKWLKNYRLDYCEGFSQLQDSKENQRPMSFWGLTWVGRISSFVFFKARSQWSLFTNLLLPQQNGPCCATFFTWYKQDYFLPRQYDLSCFNVVCYKNGWRLLHGTFGFTDVSN